MNTRRQTIGGEEPRKVTEFEQDRGNDNLSTEFEQNRGNDTSTIPDLDNEEFKESGSNNYNKFTLVCQYIEMVLFILFLLAWVIITLRFIVQILG